MSCIILIVEVVYMHITCYIIHVIFVVYLTIRISIAYANFTILREEVFNMYIMTGVSVKNSKRWYKLFIINKDENTKSWIFISESVVNALKACGVKMFENVSSEVK